MEYTKRVQAVRESIEKFSQGYGDEATKELIDGILRGRNRVQKALKNIEIFPGTLDRLDNLKLGGK
jgi:hypothetical protein